MFSPKARQRPLDHAGAALSDADRADHRADTDGDAENGQRSADLVAPKSAKSDVKGCGKSHAKRLRNIGLTGRVVVPRQIKLHRRSNDQRQHHGNQDAADDRDRQWLQHLRTRPKASDSGNMPATAAIAVITMGRSRRRPA